MVAACSAIATFFRSHAPILLFVAFIAAFVALLIGGSYGAGKRRDASWVDGIDLISGLIDLIGMFF